MRKKVKISLKSRLQKRFRQLISLSLIISLIGLMSCERPSRVSHEETEISAVNTVVDKLPDFKKISASPVPLQRIRITDSLQLTIPKLYSFSVNDEVSDEEYIGELELGDEDEVTHLIQLNDDIFSEQMATQTIYVLKAKDRAELKIEDFLDTNDKVYYKDENSAVIQASFSVFTYYFKFDRKVGSYIIYVGESAHFSQFTEAQQAEIGAYLLQNAKNLLVENPTESVYASWQDYANSRPKVMLKSYNLIFEMFGKEMTAFMEEGEISEPGGSDNTISLTMATNRMDLRFLDFASSKKEAENSDEDDDNLKKVFINKWSYRYDVTKENNLFVIKSTHLNRAYSDDEDEAKTEVSDEEPEYYVLCRMEDKRGIFYLQTTKSVSKNAVDFYSKMFAQFAKYKTLDPTKK